MAHLSYSRTFPVGLDVGFERTLTLPLTAFLGQRWLAVPGVVRVEGDGVWGSAGVGQQRTLHLGDGGRLRETLTRLDPGVAFGYALDEITGPMKALAVGVDGLWAFEPAGTGIRITWSWDVRPAGVLGRAAMPLFGRNWTGAAQRAFARLEPLLLA